MGRSSLALVLLLGLGCAPTPRGPSAPDHPSTDQRAGWASSPTAACPGAECSAHGPDGAQTVGDTGKAPTASAAPTASTGATGDHSDLPASRLDPLTEEIDDGLELPAAASSGAPARPQSNPRLANPLLALSDPDLKRRIKQDLASLGSLSLGRASSGVLVNGVKMPEGEHWDMMGGGATWGTQETVDYLIEAIEAVNRRFPTGTHTARIGHLSAKRGGALSPHKSHQSGRDVDVSYYYKLPTKHLWYRRAGAHNLDLPRTWAFVRALVTMTDVEMIFINSSIQKLIKQHALSVGEDPTWLDSIFQRGSRHRWPLVRHARGHDTHIHVRFYNPVAQELGRRAYPILVAQDRIKPHTYFTRYRARKGDMLGRLANRFGCTVKAIQRANRLRSTRIRAGRTYLIPRKGKVAAPPKVIIPQRRLPPPAAGTRRHSVAAPDTGGSH